MVGKNLLDDAFLIAHIARRAKRDLDIRVERECRVLGRRRRNLLHLIFQVGRKARYHVERVFHAFVGAHLADFGFHAIRHIGNDEYVLGIFVDLRRNILRRLGIFIGNAAQPYSVSRKCPCFDRFAVVDPDLDRSADRALGHGQIKRVREHALHVHVFNPRIAHDIAFDGRGVDAQKRGVARHIGELGHFACRKVLDAGNRYLLDREEIRPVCAREHAGKHGDGNEHGDDFGLVGFVRRLSARTVDRAASARGIKVAELDRGDARSGRTKRPAIRCAIRRRGVATHGRLPRASARSLTRVAVVPIRSQGSAPPAQVLHHSAQQPRPRWHG